MIQCLTDDSEESPCRRCVEKGLHCEYVPIAEQGESRTPGSNNPSAGYLPTTQPVSPPVQAPSAYRAPQGSTYSYAPPQKWMTTPVDATSGPARSGQSRDQYPGGGQQIPRENCQYFGAPQGYSTSSGRDRGHAPALPYSPSAALPTTYGYPSNWPAFSSPSSQPQ
ncbi:hypothetical protein K438DRAFT_2066214 [Mycena galopus ATCC 62051]|nr:hypothetical protein K438DRAFT_2066214 [Mycena galopus ATCC 62051]